MKLLADIDDLRVEARKMIKAGWTVENVMAALEMPLEEKMRLECFYDTFELLKNTLDEHKSI